MVFFVTGGSRGIGREIVLQAVREGHDVAFTFVRQAALAREVEAAALDLRPDARCLGYQLDVRDSAAVDRVSEAVLDHFESVGAVVCNAGITRDNLLVNMTDEEWADVVTTNLTGSFYVCRAFMPSLLAQRFGRVVLISSVVHAGATGQANYSASKAGLHGLAGSIAREYGRRRITANVIVPGFFDTPMTRETMPEENKAFWIKYCPQGRMGDLSEISRVVTFLASDGAGFINGQTIPVTGGLDWSL
jgi:NAD(P)-dependent dehydrogenase (short-subunit alcohol dehydrogenase family)